MKRVSSVARGSAAKPREATWPGPQLPAKPQRVIDIELHRVVFDDDPADTYVSWHAEWGLRGSSSGTEHSSEDLTELVTSVTNDARRMYDRSTLHLEWALDGDAPAGQTVADAVAECDVQLPKTLP